MILVVLTNNMVGHPRENDLWPGDANQSYDFVQRFAVAPLFERVQNICAGGIGAMQEPCQRDPIRGKPLACFYFTNVGQRICLFLSPRITARVSSSRVHDRHSLVLLLNRFGEVSGNLDVVIGMSHDN